MVRQLCLPQLRSNNTWPASVSKDLVSSLERYMANLTDLANVAAGKTVLYVPNDDLSQPHVCAEDKVLLPHLTYKTVPRLCLCQLKKVVQVCMQACMQIRTHAQRGACGQSHRALVPAPSRRTKACHSTN